MTLLTVPETLSEYERERGKPMPSLNHSAVQARLIIALARNHGTDHTILSELTLDTIPVMTPDLCVYPKLELDWLHDEVRVAEPPLLVIEILSPSQNIDDLVEKIEHYFAFGVRSCWLVQPTLKLIAVFTPQREPQVYTTGPVRDPATGISVTVEDVFTP